MRTGKIALKDRFAFLGEDGADPQLEYYLPYNMPEMGWQDKKRPVLLVCPGGGYHFVSERESEPIALNYLTRGYNVFVLTYSCDPICFPHQLNEVAAAFELINENADEWNCDMENTAIMGFSAGGHLAAHYSTSYNCEEVRANFPESIKPKVSVLCYPVITAEKPLTHYGSFYSLLGHFPNGEEGDKYSCEKLVSDDTPPAYIWANADDSGVPCVNSLRYATALSQHNIPFELHIFPFGGHGLSTANDQTLGDVAPIIHEVTSWLTESADFMEKFLTKKFQ